MSHGALDALGSGADRVRIELGPLGRAHAQLGDPDRVHFSKSDLEDLGRVRGAAALVCPDKLRHIAVAFVACAELPFLAKTPEIETSCKRDGGRVPKTTCNLLDVVDALDKLGTLESLQCPRPSYPFCCERSTRVGESIPAQTLPSPTHTPVHSEATIPIQHGTLRLCVRASECAPPKLSSLISRKVSMRVV